MNFETNYNIGFFHTSSDSSSSSEIGISQNRSILKFVHWFAMSLTLKQLTDQKAWRKASSLAILLILFVTSLGISQHHHDDLREHDDCQVCVLASTVATPPDAPVAPVVFLQTEILEHSSTPVLIPQVLGQIYQARAPPV